MRQEEKHEKIKFRQWQWPVMGKDSHDAFPGKETGYYLFFGY